MDSRVAGQAPPTESIVRRNDGDDSGDSTGGFIEAFRRFAFRVDTVGLGCDGPCGSGDDGELTVASLKALLGLVPGNEG